MAIACEWAGVDVGGRRKGFHVAAVDCERRVAHGRAPGVGDCVDALRSMRAGVVAIDAPSSWASDGDLSRACERAFMSTGLCGIRYTPDAATAAARTDRFLEWIELGLELWHAVRASGAQVIECFPTASWTAWLGPRGGRSRARWTKEGIARLARGGIAGLEAVRNQDERDAVVAALTARQWSVAPSTVDRFGDLAVPSRSSLEVVLGTS